MRFAPTDDQLALRDGVADLLGATCTPMAVRSAWESESGRLTDVWEQLTEMGVLALEIPEELGGLGFGPMEAGLILAEAGRVALSEPVVDTVAVSAPLLARAATTSDGAAEYCQRLIGGATVGVALADTPFVSHAATADALLAERDKRLYLVTDFEVSPTVAVDRSRRLAAVDWDTGSAISIGDADAVGEARDRGAVASASVLCGLAETMIAMAVGYAGERKQFGVPIGTFQAVKHHLSNAELAVSFARPLVRRAEYSLAVGAPEASLHASMAKVAAAEAAHKVGQITLQVHGAIAYTVEYDHQLFLKRVWGVATDYGDAGFHTERVAAAVLD